MDICIYFNFFIKKVMYVISKMMLMRMKMTRTRTKIRSMIKKMTMVSMMIMRMMNFMMAIFIILRFGLLGQNMSLDCVVLVWEGK